MIYDPNMSTGSLYNCNDVSVSQPSTGGWWMLYLIITSDCQTPPSPPPAAASWTALIWAASGHTNRLPLAPCRGQLWWYAAVCSCVAVWGSAAHNAPCHVPPQPCNITEQSSHQHNHSQHSAAQHTDFLDDASSEINNFSRHRCVKRRGLAVLCKVPWERMSWHYYTRSCPVSRRAM